MKASNIQVGNLYEVKSGHNVTVVTVKAINKKTGGWTCETTKGKRMNIADPKRFVKEVMPKKEKAVAEKSAPDKKKPVEKKPTLKEVIESKVVATILKGRRATSSMRDLDDPTFTRKHHVKNGVLVLEADGEQPKHLGPKPLGAMSALAAAHRVLQEAGRPLTVREIMETALAKNYCVLNGKTIFNTFNGGIRKEIKAKGDQSRFVWVERGLFAAR